MSLFGKLGGSAKVNKAAKKAFEGTIAVDAEEVPSGTMARMKAAVGHAKAGDLGTIRQELLPRGRGVITYIDFDDGVSVKLPEGTKVYPSIRSEAAGFASDLARGGGAVGRGAVSVGEGVVTLGRNFYTGSQPVRRARVAKVKPTLMSARRKRA